MTDDHTAFGHDRLGRGAEKAARFFGTPGYIVGQSIAVVIWIGLNSLAIVNHWDPYPFILLNLLFSTQAAYAAPLILLAQTRQAERERVKSEAFTRPRRRSRTHWSGTPRNCARRSRRTRRSPARSATGSPEPGRARWQL